MLRAPEWSHLGTECGCDELQSAPRGGTFMFGKFVAGKLNRAFGKGRKMTVSVGLAVGLLAVVACQAPDQTSTEVVSDTPLLSDHVNCRDLAAIDIASVRSWSTAGSAVISDYIFLELSDDSPAKNNNYKIVCKGTAVFDNGKMRERYILGEIANCNHQLQAWERIVPIKDFCILVYSFITN